MMIIPSIRFSKLNSLNLHRHHCSSLIKNCLNAIIIGDSIAAGLNRYPSICTRYLEPLKTLKCGIGGDKIQNVGPRISYQASKMSLFYVGQMTCSKIHMKTLQMVLQKLRNHFNPAIIQSILPLVAYSLVMPAGLLIGCL